MVIGSRKITRRCSRWVEVDLLESQALQEAADRRSRILLRRAQNVVRQRGRLQLAFRLLAHLRFEIRIGGHEQSGLPRKHTRLAAVEARAEHLRGWKMHPNLPAIDSDVVRFQIRKVISRSTSAPSHLS